MQQEKKISLYEPSSRGSQAKETITIDGRLRVRLFENGYDILGGVSDVEALRIAEDRLEQVRERAAQIEDVIYRMKDRLALALKGDLRREAPSRKVLAVGPMPTTLVEPKKRLFSRKKPKAKFWWEKPVETLEEW